MTAGQRNLMFWSGGLALVLIVGWWVLAERAEKLKNHQDEAKELTRKYADLYPANGIPASEALSKWNSLLAHQEAALKQAEDKLVPDLPDGYTNTDLNRAAAQVHADLLHLKQRAESKKAALPSVLPFEEGLDADAEQRGLQLAQLYLYRTAIDTCLDAAVNRISSIQVAKGHCDPDGKYAVLLCELDLGTTFDIADQLLIDFVEKNHAKGIGVWAVSLDQTRDGSQQFKLTVSLLTINHPAWQLKPEAEPVAAPTRDPVKPPVRPAGGGRRGGRLGGG
jgi:hypothetical protein